MGGAQIQVGSTVGTYRLSALLGRGGMGLVFLADDLRLSRRVALKVLQPELTEDDEFAERFLRETRIAASLDHPHIVPVYDAGEVEGRLYLAMRYVDGTDLRSLLLREGRLSLDRSTRVVEQVASALSASHARGLVHRDVKPGNILIARGVGAEDHAYLADFGLAKDRDGDRGVTRTSQVIGTLDYMSPEQLRGEMVDERTDIYALGCVWYQCVAGIAPYKGTDVAVMLGHLQEPPPPLPPDLDAPPKLTELIHWAMAKDPAQRPESCDEYLHAIQQGIRPLATPKPAAEGPARGLRRPVRVRPSVAVGIVGAVVAVMLTVVLVFAGGSNGHPRPASAVGTLVAASLSIPPPVNDLAEVNGSVVVAGQGALTPVDGQSGRRSGRPIPVALGSNGVFANPGPTTVTVVVPPPHGSAPLRFKRLGLPGRGTVWVAATDALRLYRPPSPRPLHTIVTGSLGTGATWQPAVVDGQLWASFLDTHTKAGLVVDRLKLGHIDELVDPDGTRYADTGRLSEIGNGPFSLDHQLWVLNADLERFQRLDPRTGRVVQSLVTGPIYDATYVPPSVWLVGAKGLGRMDPNSGQLRWTRTSDNISVTGDAGGIWTASGLTGVVSRFDPSGRLVGRIRYAEASRVQLPAKDAVLYQSPAYVSLAVAGGSVWVANGRDGSLRRILPALSPLAVAEAPAGYDRTTTLTPAISFARPRDWRVQRETRGELILHHEPLGPGSAGTGVIAIERGVPRAAIDTAEHDPVFVVTRPAPDRLGASAGVSFLLRARPGRCLADGCATLLPGVRITARARARVLVVTQGRSSTVALILADRESFPGLARSALDLLATVDLSPPPLSTLPVEVSADISPGHVSLSRTTLRPGYYTFRITNRSLHGTHQPALDRLGSQTFRYLYSAAPVHPGETVTFTAHLTPGAYTVYCGEPGHAARGEQATLRVAAGP